MRLIDGHDYVTIKDHKVIVVNGETWDWIPDCVANAQGVVPPYVKHGYLGTILHVDSRKPYVTRSRIRVSGIFPDYLTLAGFREIEVYLEDAVLYTCVQGMLQEHVKKKQNKPKENLTVTMAQDLSADLDSEEIDNERDAENLE